MEFRNNINQFPRIRNWMIGVDIADNNKDENNLLVGISELNLPIDINSICKIDNMPYLFYTRQSEKYKLYIKEFDLNKKIKKEKNTSNNYLFKIIPGCILDINSDGEYLYLLIKDNEAKKPIYSIVKIYNISKFISKTEWNYQDFINYECCSENRLDFDTLDTNNESDIFVLKIATTTFLPNRSYIYVNCNERLYKGRYKHNKGYIIKVSAINNQDKRNILSNDIAKNNKVYYILDNQIYYEEYYMLNTTTKPVLNISFINEHITALNYFIASINVKQNIELLIISTQYNLYAFNINTREFYSLLSYKGTIEFKINRNSPSLKDYNLLKDNSQFTINFDNNGNAFGDVLPGNYINRLYSFHNICVFFGSNKFLNWGVFLKYEAYLKMQSNNSEKNILKNISNETQHDS